MCWQSCPWAHAFEPEPEKKSSHLSDFTSVKSKIITWLFAEPLVTILFKRSECLSPVTNTFQHAVSISPAFAHADIKNGRQYSQHLWCVSLHQLLLSRWSCWCSNEQCFEAPNLVLCGISEVLDDTTDTKHAYWNKSGAYVSMFSRSAFNTYPTRHLQIHESSLLTQM